jgi:hypothetical protein
MASLPDLLAKLPPPPPEDDATKNEHTRRSETSEEDATDPYEALRTQVNDFIAAVNEAKIEQDVADAAKSLSELDVEAGGIMAREAARKMDELVAKSKCEPKGQQSMQQCLKFQPMIQLGNSLQQIMAAMGQKQGPGQGPGQGGQDGYSMFNNDIGIYGPGMDRSATKAGNRGGPGRGSAQSAQQVASDAKDPLLNRPEATTRLHLQPDARFPLRYRDLVGDYFRAIAESEDKQ